MRTYPTGVLQNYAVPHSPPDWRPVDPKIWNWFSPKVDAELAFEFAKPVIHTVQLIDGRDAFPQFEFDQDNDIRLWTLFFKTGDEEKREFAGAIFDAATVPRPFIDQYNVGEKRQLVLNDGVLRWMRF